MYSCEGVGYGSGAASVIWPKT